MTTTSNPTTANIASWVTERAATDPDLPAIKQGETIMSYGSLDAAAARFATIMPNVIYFPIVYYAILRAGAIVVPMNPLLKAGEITYTWNDSGAKLAVVFPLFAEEAVKAASVTGTEVIITVPGDWDAELARTEPTERVAACTGADTAVIL